MVVAIALALAGCTAAPIGSVQAQPPNSGARQERPLQAYMFTQEENIAIFSALQILKERCMARYGFVLRESGAPHRPSDTVPPVPGGSAFVVEDPSNGYAVAIPAETAAIYGRQSENNAYVDALPPSSEAYKLAYSGRYKRSTDTNIPASIDETIGGVEVYPTGCEGWAWDQLAPGDPSEGSFPILREIDSWEASGADSRVAAAEDTWSTCMAAAGYSYAEPDAIQEEDRQLSMRDAGAMTSEAIAQQAEHLRMVAPIDAECRKSSGYSEVRYNVLVEYERRAIETHASALAEQRSRMDDQVRRAADVVKEAGW